MIITTDNLEQAQLILPVDQAREVVVDCETWAIYYQPGDQRGQMTVWPVTGRGAICMGGDSIWGDWDEESRRLHCESGAVYNEHGVEIVPAPED